MKVQFGTALSKVVLAQVAKWLPARALDLERIAKKASLGIEMTIVEIKPAHTDSMRAYYWTSLHAFGTWLGYSARETEAMLHPLMCAECFGQEGAREIRWKGRAWCWPVPKETSSKDADGRKRDRETYSALIETLIRFAAEQGYVVMPAEKRA